MPWFCGQKPKKLGVEILNKENAGDCHFDRKLVTGDSPLAANKFDKVCIKELLVNEKSKLKYSL
jgi:molecular chaperone Hsp31 and glyoxalase 3